MLPAVRIRNTTKECTLRGVSAFALLMLWMICSIFRESRALCYYDLHSFLIAREVHRWQGLTVLVRGYLGAGFRAVRLRTETLTRLAVMRRDLLFRQVILKLTRAEKPSIRISSNLASNKVIVPELRRMRLERPAALLLKNFILIMLESATGCACRSVLVCLRSRFFL